ncbi:hypothetical protein C3B58_06870 [Lactonifactor longoviformis]|uniref:hypothetical protein n=1 Tax=Lactonifactor longoviformis TaxID=341220 RepID=UPI000933EE1D|nr:hypothetical protein [Lactonifactor longoviformis]POP33568.1 hypothetical protein C3B58_06870 [Lactonifactor longoviformis]
MHSDPEKQVQRSFIGQPGTVSLKDRRADCTQLLWKILQKKCEIILTKKVKIDIILSIQEFSGIAVFSEIKLIKIIKYSGGKKDESMFWM